MCSLCVPNVLIMCTEFGFDGLGGLGRLVVHSGLEYAHELCLRHRWVPVVGCGANVVLLVSKETY
jgi:hypothetical protein